MRCAFREVASIITVFGSASAATSLLTNRVNTRRARYRFHRFTACCVGHGPSVYPASEAFAFDEHDAAQHPSVIDPGLAAALGKNGWKRSICLSVSQYRPLMASHFRQLDQIAAAISTDR